MRAPWLVGLLLLGAADARAQRLAEGDGGSLSAALLAASGPPALARSLDQRLPAALADDGAGSVIGAAQLRRRLAARPEVARAVARATARVISAEQLTLNMEREEAIATAREALTLLEGVGGALQVPGLAARAQLALATGLLLYPADPRRARAACQAAVAADPEIEADEDRSPPRVIRLLERARQHPRAPTRVDEALLGRVAELAGVDHLIWIGFRRASSGKRLDLELQLYDRRSGRVGTILRKQLAGEALVEGAAALARQALGTPRPVRPVQPVQPVAPVAPATPSRPWYARWWVWTAAGAVLAGTGLAVALALGGDEAPAPDHLDLRFHLP